MGLRTYITDVANNLKARIDNASGVEQSALVVATRPLKEFNNRPFFFATSEGSKDMNINVSFGGTPVKVHDGIDSVLWTGSSVIGSEFTFNSASQNHTAAGATSIEIDDALVDDIAQFAKGADLNCNNYSAITLWIYVDRNWLPEDSILLYGWDTDGNSQVGDAIKLEEHFDFTINDEWQKIAISLTDMGTLTTSTILDALRIRIATKDGGPKFYIDDIQFEETGEPTEFIVEPRKGTWLYLTAFDVTVVDAYDATLPDNSIPKIPYAGFLGVSTLTIGLQAKRVQADVVMFSATFKNLIDFMGLPNTKIAGYGSDGTDTWVKTKQKMAVPLILKSEYGDRFTYSVRDDLSGLKKLWISVACYEEIR